MSELAVRFPEDILKTVHRTADEFAADVRLASAVEWYRRGLVSQGRGARDLDLTSFAAETIVHSEVVRES